jgi:hypothetical protein
MLTCHFCSEHGGASAEAASGISGTTEKAALSERTVTGVVTDLAASIII